MAIDDLDSLREIVRGHIADAEDHPMFLLLVVASLPPGLRMYAAGDAWKKPARILRERGLVELDSFSLVDITTLGRGVAKQFIETLEMPFDKIGRWKD